MFITKILILIMVTSSYSFPFGKPFLSHLRIVHPPVPRHDRLTHDEIRKLRNQDDEVRPGLFEGDIAMNDDMYKNWRVGYRWVNYPEKFWPDGIVPYIISDLYNETSRQVIQGAVDKINFLTCVKLIPWDGKAKDYLNIYPVEKPAGCWSYVGRRGGEQPLSLKAPYGNNKACLGTEGTPMHEMMHALGTFHEQSRWDRDDHIVIHSENIITKNMKNFNKQAYNKAFTKYPYDYNSIMHYGSYFFAVDRNHPTITPKQKTEAVLGQRNGMSVLDCIKINELYGCLDESREKYYRELCEKHGIK